MNDDLTPKECADFRAELRSNLQESLAYHDGVTKMYYPYDPFELNEPGLNVVEAHPLTSDSVWTESDFTSLKEFKDATTCHKSFDERLDEVIKKAVREAIEEKDVVVRPKFLKYKLKHR